MKAKSFKSILVLATFALYLFPAFAQSPEKMSYQAVIRNSSDVLVINTQIGMEINIRQGSVSGAVVYTETQNPTTNANGLVSIEIGSGEGFDAIDWLAGPYFIETNTDPTGGTDYTISGTSQLLSVPYAFHAKVAESIVGSISESQISDLQNYATKDYVDILIERIEILETGLQGTKGLVLWNKMGSIEEVENSEIGPNGTIVGDVNFNNTVKFGQGLTPNSGYAESGVDFPTTVVNPEKGCVEMWVIFYYKPIPFSYGVYGFINVNFWSHNVMSFAWHNEDSLFDFVLQFNGNSRSASLTEFDPFLNTPIHIACVWDRTGIDGTSEYMRTYVNGVKMAVNDTYNDWGTDNTSGNFRVATPWDGEFETDRYSVSNLKVWDYAKTYFDLSKE